MFERTTKVLPSRIEEILGDPRGADILEKSEVAPRLTLEDFVNNPFTPEEIQTKGDYIKEVFTPFSAALSAAEYDNVDFRLKNSLDRINFTNTPEQIVADINRIIKNFYIQTPVAAIAPVEKKYPDSPFAPKKVPVRSNDDLPPAPVHVSGPDRNLVSSIEAQLEQSMPEYPEDVSEDERKTPVGRIEPQFGVAQKNAKVSPLILKNPLSETLVLTKEQQLPETLILSKEQQLPETLILSKEQRVPELLVLTPNMVPQEKLVLTPSLAMGKHELTLENMSNLEFSQIRYLEFINTVHTDVRSKFDTIKKLAETNLKKFNPIYTPGTIEKEALQFWSRLQAQAVRLGMYEKAVTDNLVQAEPFNVDEIKRTVYNYVAASENLLDGITELQGLIEKAAVEEKPPFAEAYRAQLEKMRVEGNQVLATVPSDHPLFIQFKFIIIDDLGSLTRQISVAEGGDKIVQEQSSILMVRRDRIKAAIAYMKTEHEYEDFMNRAHRRVQELALAVEKVVPVGTEALHTKNTLLAKIDAMVVMIATKNTIDADTVMAFAVPSVVTARYEALTKQKTDIQNLLGEANVIFSQLSGLSDVIHPSIIATEKPLILENPISVPGKISAVLTQRVSEIKKQSPDSVTFNERVAGILKQLHPKKIGLVTALATFLATLPSSNNEDTQIGSSAINQLEASPLSAISNSASELDYNAIFAYLRSVPAANFSLQNSSVTAPGAFTEVRSLPLAQVEAPTPSVLFTPTEVVPGVVFSARADQVAMPDMPDLAMFSPQADQVPADDGIVFANPPELQPDKLYKINFGDRFWDINEEQTLAGKLPVMSQINPYFKQSLIDRMRDKINTDSVVRTKIGGMKNSNKDSADSLMTGEYINLTALNELGVSIAVEYGYLK